MADNRDPLDRLLDSALASYADPGPDFGLEDRVLRRIGSEAAPVARRRWLAWAIALPVAAGLLIFAVLSGMRHVQMSPASPQARSSRQPSAPGHGEIAAGRTENRIRGQDAAGAKAGHTFDSVNGPTEVVPCYKTSPSSRVSTPCEAANSKSSEVAPVRRGETPLHEAHLRGVHLEARSMPLPKLDVFPTPRPLTPQEQALVNFAAHATKSDRESLIAAQREADAPLRIAAIEIKPLEPPASGEN